MTDDPVARFYALINAYYLKTHKHPKIAYLSPKFRRAIWLALPAFTGYDEPIEPEYFIMYSGDSYIQVRVDYGLQGENVRFEEAIIP